MSRTLSRRPHDPRRARHWQMLWISLAIVALSVALRLDSGGSVEAPLGEGWRLPPLCSSRAWFGFECPGCGLTRSFVALGEGDLAASLEHHRVGWLLAAAVLVQLPYRVYELSRPRRSLSEGVRTAFGWSLVVALVGNWLLKVVPGW